MSVSVPPPLPAPWWTKPLSLPLQPNTLIFLLFSASGSVPLFFSSVMPSSPISTHSAALLAEEAFIATSSTWTPDPHKASVIVPEKE